MTRPLSNDIRERLVSAVDGGLSCRSAAKRFGVAASTAIDWVGRWRRTGDIRPRPQGGDKRSQRIEAHAGAILALIEETPDITLAEIAAYLDDAHDVVRCHLAAPVLSIGCLSLEGRYKTTCHP